MKPYTHLSETLFFKGAKKITVITVVTMILLFSTKTYAQVKLNPNMTAAQSARVLNDADFKKTSLYATRLKLYGASFTNPTKSFSMTDGTSMNVSFIKNPSFPNQANIVTPTLYTGPVENAPNNVPVQAVTESNQGWVCNNYTAGDRATSVNFNVTDYTQQMPYIYPSAVFTFDNFMNGSLQPPSGLRNAITLATDNSTSNNFVQVANPNQSTVSNTVSSMVSHFISSGNISTNYKYYESNNMADWAIRVNAGEGNYGAQINTAFNTTDRRHHRYITIDVTKQLYSIFTNPPSNGFYSATNSTEATPNLMVVGSVAYGVRLLVNMELTFASNADAVAFQNNFGYLSYSETLDMNYLQSHSSDITNISSYEIGGPNSGTVFVNSNSLQSNINNILASVTNQNAKPVSYQLYDMAWDMIGATASTGYFNYVNCLPALPPSPSDYVLASATFTVHCGSDGKNKGTAVTVLSAPATSNSITGNILLYNSQASSCGGGTQISWPNNATMTFPFCWDTYDNHQLVHPHLSDFESNWNLTISVGNPIINIGHDDITNFSLTLNLTFASANDNKTYSIPWYNLNLSTSNQALSNLTLHYHYSNGTFVTTTQ